MDGRRTMEEAELVVGHSAAARIDDGAPFVRKTPWTRALVDIEPSSQVDTAAALADQAFLHGPTHDGAKRARAAGTFDVVDRPKHYNTGKIETWDFILDQDLPYLIGNVIKYAVRFRHKGTPLQDLKKARAYLDKQIAILEAASSSP